MKKLRIVFMGSPDFAIPSLEALHKSEHEIVAVASNPDKRRGRGGKPQPTVVKKKAMDLDYPTIDVEDPKSDEFAEKLIRLKPDLLVVVAFRILPNDILSIPTIGSINLHASLLPKYRGAAPIHWAIIKGEEETGCSVFFLDEKVDTGEIIAQFKTDIGPMETTGDVYNRLKDKGAELLKDAVDQIAEGTTEGKPQKHEEATPAPKLFKENTKIDFNQSAEDVHNLIRGLNPFPTAWCKFGDQKLNIHRSKPGPKTSNAKPGQLVDLDNRLYVQCGDGLLELLELQLPGTKRLSGVDFLNGYDTSVQLN
ncbi:methionyl-tRNA formyltransferase [Rhodohalobacter sp.]|uniref:methionyl-tRNA formyltransferase n=1 Tax=Rhodohalobacter sp. TaxID=1974210 RepID=UPI002ACDA6C3|nr:methionyl-tRNA formyltransferase [Rhodohalobacter sp.]MDZ7758569.1 methionyl-tRNA formyltransferase [Rhodohalobacter sp.]